MKQIIKQGIGISIISILLAACASSVSKEETVALIPSEISPEAKSYYENTYRWGKQEVDLSRGLGLNLARRVMKKRMHSEADTVNPELISEKVDVDGVPAYWLKGPNTLSEDKVILWVHGGAYVLGSAEKTGMAARMATISDMPILSVDYRLAPEHPFPAGLQDVRKAYLWLLKMGYYPKDIVIFGSDSGGGLALSAVMSLRNDSMPLPAAIAVMSPWADLTGKGDTYETLVDVDPLLSWKVLSTAVKAYVGEARPEDPLVSPVFGDFSEFPPILVQVGTRDMLLSDSVSLARKARQYGTDVTLDVWNGMWHAWQGYPEAPEGQQAAEEVARFFDRHLQKTVASD